MQSVGKLIGIVIFVLKLYLCQKHWLRVNIFIQAAVSSALKEQEPLLYFKIWRESKIIIRPTWPTWSWRWPDPFFFWTGNRLEDWKCSGSFFDYSCRPCDCLRVRLEVGTVGSCVSTDHDSCRYCSRTRCRRLCKVWEVNALRGWQGRLQVYMLLTSWKPIILVTMLHTRHLVWHWTVRIPLTTLGSAW